MSGNTSSPASLLNRANHELKRTTEDKDFFKNCANALEQENVSLNGELAKVKEQLHLRDATVVQLREKLTQLQNINDDQLEEFGRLQQEISISKLDASLFEEKENRHQRYAELERELEQAYADSAKTQQKLKAENDEVKLQIVRLEAEKQDVADRLEREVAKRLAVEALTKETIRALETSVRDKRAEILQTETSKNHEIRRLLMEVEEKEDIIRSKEGPEIQLRLDFAKLEDELTAKNEELVELMSRLEAVHYDLVSEKRKRTESESQLTLLQTEKEQQQQALEAVVQARNDNSRMVEGLRQEILRLTVRCQNKEEELSIAATDIGNFMDRTSQLAKEADAAEKTIQDLNASTQNLQIRYEKSIQSLESDLSCAKTALAERDAEKLQQEDQSKSLAKTFEMLKMELNAERELKENSQLKIKTQNEEIASLKRELLSARSSQDPPSTDLGNPQANPPLSKWSSQASEFGSMVFPEFGSAMKGSCSSRSGSAFPVSGSQMSMVSAHHFPDASEDDYVEMASSSIPRETRSSPASKNPRISNFVRTRTLRHKYFKDSGFHYNTDTPTRQQELADRNARMPNHLKSSYPTETTASTWRHSSPETQSSPVAPVTPPSSGTKAVKKTSAFKTSALNIFRRSIKKKSRRDGTEKGIMGGPADGSPAPVSRPGPLKGKHKPAESFEVPNTPKKKKKV